MPGRHMDHRPPRARWPRRVLVALATVVVLASAGLIGRAFLDSGDGRCRTADRVAVTADPTIANQVTQLAEMYTSDQSDGCADVTVTAQESSEAAANLADSPPDVWVPDSSYWRSQLPDAELVNSRGSIATSPLVAVTSRQVAEGVLGWPDREFSWAGATTASKIAVTVPDPSTTTEGIGTLFAVSATQKDASATDLVRAMSAMSQATVETTGKAYQGLGANAQPTVFTAAEQSVVAHNRADPETPAVALYPSEGTIAFDFPAFVVADSPSASVATDFAEYLGSSASQKVLESAGFRTSGGELSVSEDAGVQASPPDIIAGPEPAAVQELSRQWSALSLDMRMLSVIDISGSMAEFVDEDTTRIDITRDAAKSALTLLPPDSEVGMWAFSTLEDDPRDYVELAPVAPLDEQADGHTHAEALSAAADELPDRVADGGTALYDTTLAAFQAMQADYESKKVNSVVIMTDGRDEFDDDGIDLETLLDKLTSQFDPAAPVAVIGIGIGPDADTEALKEISAATGASAYHAEDPRDIQSVFLQAMIERQCRPNC